MRRARVWLAAALVLGASWAAAAPIVDWNRWEPGKNLDVVTDTKGTLIRIDQAEGPLPGEKALKATASLGEWGAVWVEAKTDWRKVKAIRFKAKASAPGLLEVALIDQRLVRYVCKVRVVSDDWETFVLPLASFRPTDYPSPGVGPRDPLDLATVDRLQFSPWTAGTTTYWVGPIDAAPPDAAPSTGMPDVTVATGHLVVQDFLLMDKRSYGPFTDGSNATVIRMDVLRDPEKKGAAMASVHYEVNRRGWCGLWLRCGIDWGGQDWRGGRVLRLKYRCDEDLPLEIGFNDRHQNAYVTYTILKDSGDSWNVVEVPLASFRLNHEYQPPEGRKGATLDLSRIETFNLKPLAAGDHDFQLREVSIDK